MAIIGAGAVGVEFASMFNRFGTKVTLLEMLPRLVPVEDEEVSKELERVFQEDRDPRGNRRKGAKASTQDRPGVSLTATLANGNQRDGVRKAADRGRAQAEHGKHRP